MKLDIHTAVTTAVIIAGLLFVYLVWAGIRSIQKARTLKFFRMRRDRMVIGWRMLLFAVIFLVGGLLIRRFAEPIAYNFFPPTITPTLTGTTTLTPTISLTPTITVSPSITPTPLVSNTPTITGTPRVPLAIESLFTSSVTPNPAAIFSPLIFAQALDENFLPVNPAIVFQNPVGHLYAQFTYDQMIPESQWTSLWYRGTELVWYETKPWDGGTGGIGYTDWLPEAYEWLPGEYEVQIFVGYIWKASGRFTVEGEAPTPPPSATPSATPSPTRTATGTRTPYPTLTATPTRTVTRTPAPTPTRTVTRTTWPTVTFLPTHTPRPPATITPTRTVTRTLAPTHQ
jgi:hypothetical protein